MTLCAEDKANPALLPWRPLYTIERGEKTEVTVYGIISVVVRKALTNKEQEHASLGEPFALPLEDRYQKLVGVGDDNFTLWTRSLLKPWQLLSHIEILKAAYPALKEEHYALFMASHSGEPMHIEALEEIIKITSIEESMLACPPATPVSSESKALMKERAEKPRRRYHNCSGKHAGYLAALKAVDQEAYGNYIKSNHQHHNDLINILSTFTGRSKESFVATTDGCQLPNYALSTFEIACIYESLFGFRRYKESLPSQWQAWGELGSIMNHYPRHLSGLGRVDYKVMTGELFPGQTFTAAAKEGADGLLGVSIVSDQYPNGLAICIKLSSGFENKHMEILLKELLRQLHLLPPKGETKTDAAGGIKVDHIKTHFHFQVQGAFSEEKPPELQSHH